MSIDLAAAIEAAVLKKWGSWETMKAETELRFRQRIETDSEFRAATEQACAQRGVPLPDWWPLH